MKTLVLFMLATVLSPVPPPSPSLTTFNGVIEDLTQTPVPSGTITFTLKPGVDTTISGSARFTPTNVVCAISNAPVVSTSGTGTVTVVVSTPQTWQAGDSLIFVGTADPALNTTTVIAPVTITAVNSPTSFSFLFTGTHTNAAGGSVGGIYAASGTGPCAVTQNSQINPANTSYSVAIQPAGTTTSTFNTYAIGAGPVDITTIVPTPSQQPAYSFVDLFSNGQQISGLKNFSNPGNTFLGGTYNNPILNNATFNGSTANNWTLNTPVIQTPIFKTQPITLGGLAHAYQIVWTTPTANRVLSIGDPGATDAFVFQAAAQALTNKSLGAGTLFSAPPASVNGHTTAGDVGVGTTVLSKTYTNAVGAITPGPIYSYSSTTVQGAVLIYYSVTTINGASGGGTASATFTWQTGAVGLAPTINKTTQTVSLVTTGSETDGVFVAYPANGTNISLTTTNTTPFAGQFAVQVTLVLQ